jgi:L-2,4-diaminobutyrate decarboxylase
LQPNFSIEALVFESEFLVGNDHSKESYRQLIVHACHTVFSSLPQHPYNGKNATTLANLVDADFLPEYSSSLDHIADLLRLAVSNSVTVSHPFTAAHLHCPPLLAALAAEVVISALNQSMDSFDQAPFATIVERQMIRGLCQQAGLPDPSDGTFTTGGSQSNYFGLLLARDVFLQKQWKWSAQKSGLPPESRQLRILCSEVAHFTVEKSASQLGLGTDAVVRVAVDGRFRMNPEALRSALKAIRDEGLLPMAIVATAGTTDFGSVDPLTEVSALARAEDVWLHVDAAYGGALLFGNKLRDKLQGIEAADSLSIDFHKLLWQPIPCSAFLLRDTRHFDTIKLHADYLNPENHEDEGIPNLVTTSLLTSRRFDALKLWISFQTLGRAKLAAMIDRTIELAAHAAEVVRNTPSLELVCAPELSTVLFRFAPSRAELDADRLNAALRQRLFGQGIAVIGNTRVHNRQCLKLTLMNPTVQEDQIQLLLRTVADHGEQMERDLSAV